MDNVLITGASRGLGLAMARRLADDGFNVIALARKSNEALDAAVARSGSSGRGAIAFEAFDLAAIDAIPALVRDLKKRHGRLFALINNAGLGTHGVLATTSDSDIETLLRVNTLAPIVLSKYVVRAMMADGRGRIVNVASISALTGFNAMAPYAASKAALVGFTRSLAREVGKVGVTVNAIAPGFIETDMTSMLDDAGRARILARSALRRMAKPEDVAATAAFLLSEGGRNITGAVMTVDAGATA
jgi:3-oxoacyl-[acyl-carrier protein] reductase